MAEKLSGNPQDFVNLMASYALTAQQATGINANVILAQWGNETAWGTSSAWVNNSNPAGIGITSSGVSGKNYGTIGGGVQGYIDFINNNSRYQAVKAAGASNPEAQALAMGSSGYASGGYLAKGSSVAGSSLIQDMLSFTAPSGISPATGLSVPDAASTSTPSATVQADSKGGLADVISSVLQPYGLDTPAIESWATSAVTNYLSGGMTAAEAATQIGIDLQEPKISAVDPGLAAAQRAFQALYPGLAQRNANGYPPMTVAAYQQYQDAAIQTATAAGISTGPNGLLSPAAIGTLIGNDVGLPELTDRITKGYQAATQANPETLTLLQHYYPGIFPSGPNGSAPTSGQLVSYYLDPAHTQVQLDNQITAAQIGTEGVNSQFGGIPASQAIKLQQAGISQSTARTTFEQLAKLTPLENALPGVAADANSTISQQNLVNFGFFGANQQELENVQSTRRAPFSGGGGYAATAKGVVGAGGASIEGTTGT